MKAIKLTLEQVRNSDKREYNPSEWDRIINGYENKYENVEYFVVPKDARYSYDRYFVEYTLPEGLRLLGSLSYGSSLTNGGFYSVVKIDVGPNGETIQDVLDLMANGEEDAALYLMGVISESDFVNIKTHKLLDDKGNQVAINNSPQAREYMTKNSKKHGLVYTKEWLG